ncbi:unnamed protein product [Phytophthora fragariaefolia]|uniref:Unnamed protein product n=1 Tax=Phytophthora fragariaefolia TaxID=1490495 RepID=A0A9W6U4G4_9STRA|nr:unnamed protein product [Phytophthora fragariaefolia]
MVSIVESETAEHPDLTSAGRKDYDLPDVGGGSVDADSPDDIEHNSIPLQIGSPASGVSSPWLQRKLPSFNDDVVLHPDISRKRHDRDNMQGNGIDVNKHRQADAASQKPPKARGDGDERRGGLIKLPDPDDEEISLEEMQAYAAFLAIALITEEPKPQQRVWHISEVWTPRTVPLAMNSPQRAEWWKGMEKEVAAMLEKDVLELVPESEMAPGTKPLETTWRFQPKTDEFGNILRFRSRLCGRGDKEVPGIDCSVLDTFSPVARMTSFRMFIALCEILELFAFQCDIDTAHLNAQKRLIQFIRRIAGFPLKPGWTYKVKRALYGLHESGRA